MLNKLTAHLAYYGKAAFHTFWQAALAALVGSFGASGLNLAHLPQVSDLEKIGISAAVAGAAAVLSYIKELLVKIPPGAAQAIEPLAQEGISAAEEALNDAKVVAVTPAVNTPASTPAPPSTGSTEAPNGTASAG